MSEQGVFDALTALYVVAFLEICLFIGKWGFLDGLSCVLWIVVSALWIAEYRLERSQERKAG